MTSKTPATKQINPKRVAVGKAIAQKTKQTLEVQKKALAEAQIIIANNQLKQDDPPPVADTPSADSPPVAEPREIKAQANQNFTNTDCAFKLYNQAHPTTN